MSLLTDTLHALPVKTLVNGGIAVMGHIGLLPQHISVLGGFRAQGRTGKRWRIVFNSWKLVDSILLGM